MRRPTQVPFPFLPIMLLFQSTPTTKGLSATVPWITCASSVELNRAVVQHVRAGDCVVEFGSQLQDTSKLIVDAVTPAGTAILLDTQRKIPKKVTSRNENFRRGTGDVSVKFGAHASFVELDSFESWRCVAALEESFKGISAPFDILVCDLGGMTGNDLTLTTVSFIREFLSRMGTNSPRVVLVKSTALCKLAWRLIHSQRLFDGSASIYPRKGQSHFRTPGNMRGEPTLIAAVGVEEYRRTIPKAVRRGDRTLELGCHLGVTTALLHDASTFEPPPSPPPPSPTSSLPVLRSSGGCVGVDIGPKIIDRAHERFPHLNFLVGDAWRTAELQRVASTTFGRRGEEEASPSSYDAVYVDVGGLSGSDGVLEALSLLEALGKALEPRVIVIKSLCMRRLASSLRPFSESWIKVHRRERA